MQFRFLFKKTDLASSSSLDDVPHDLSLSRRMLSVMWASSLHLFFFHSTSTCPIPLPPKTSWCEDVCLLPLPLGVLWLAPGPGRSAWLVALGRRPRTWWGRGSQSQSQRRRRRRNPGPRRSWGLERRTTCPGRGRSLETDREKAHLIPRELLDLSA